MTHNVSTNFQSLGATFSDPTLTSKEVQAFAKRLFTALTKATSSGTGRQLPKAFIGNYQGVAAACASIAHQEHGTSADLDWQKSSMMNKTSFNKGVKELNKLFRVDIEQTFTRGKGPSSSGTTPKSTPEKRKAPSSASRTTSSKRARIEGKSAKDIDAELADPNTPTRSNSRRSATSAVTPTSTPTKAKGKERQASPSEDSAMDVENALLASDGPALILDLQLPPRVRTGDLDPHDYELDPAYGRDERREATKAWREKTLAVLKERL